MKIDINKLQELVAKHYLSCRKHPTEELYIWNYTPKCQYEPFWTEETLMCRGLITDKEGNIVSRPFKKFFNLQEHKGTLPEGDFEVTEKIDGSLGILYWVGEIPYIATRGSFESDQAKMANKILRKYDGVPFKKGRTYLMEIVYPDNRIVVDYGRKEDLIMLAVIDNETGLDMPQEDLGMNWTTYYHGLDTILGLGEFEMNNKEGFVLKWENGLRLKYKFEEYVRLHRLVTQVTARSIWDLLRTATPFTELLDRVPDEFYTWVKATSKRLTTQYAEIYAYGKERAKVVKEMTSIPNSVEGRVFLNYDLIQRLDNEYRRKVKDSFKRVKPEWEGICWMFYQKQAGDKIQAAIWKLLYPAHETPFKKEI